MKPSIHSTAELARHLGLSRWSVSRAINGQNGVSPATTEQVRAAMEKFGFTPSPHARGLQGRRTGAIGVCFRELHTPITIQKIRMMQRLVRGRGYRPLFEFAEQDHRMGPDVIQHFIAMRVEGVLLVDTPAGAEIEEWLRTLKRHGIPAVVVEPLGPVPHNCVYLDRVTAMTRVTEELLAHGHRRFALLGISRKFPLGRPRHDGVMRALAAHGLDPAAVLDTIEHTEHRYGGLRYGRELAEQLLAQPRLPSALIALNDEVAAGALWHLQKAGRQCPQDFSIVGFDNLVLSEQTHPTLTTVDHNVDAMATAAVEMLFQLIEHGPTKKLPVVKIAPALVSRESVAAPSR